MDLALHILRGRRGQSLTEMIVMLPVLLMLFLGLFHFRDIVQLRMRAIEAARYVNWESVWNARDAYGLANKDDEQLRRELVNLGLGRGLVAVQGTAAVRTLEDYTGSVSGEGMALFPVIVDRLFPEMDTSGGTAGDIIGGIEDASQALSGVFSKFADVFFWADLTMAKSTLWSDEGQDSVYTARVVYRHDPEAFFRPFGATIVDERSSLLTHGYNVSRPGLPDFGESYGGGGIGDYGVSANWWSDDGMVQEYEAVFGPTSVGGCFDGENGHIFDLWLFPTGDLLGALGDDTAQTIGEFISEVGGGVKCAITTPFEGLQEIDDALGTDLGFHMPSGTLMEYPENWD